MDFLKCSNKSELIKKQWTFFGPIGIFLLLLWYTKSPIFIILIGVCGIFLGLIFISNKDLIAEISVGKPENSKMVGVWLIGSVIFFWLIILVVYISDKMFP